MPKPISRRQRLARRTGVALLIIFVCGLWVSWIVAGRLVAPVPRSVGQPPAGVAAESISLESESGAQISGWHLRADEPQGVVVLLHGIRGCRLSMLDRAKFLRKAGYSIVMIDLQGHGESPGVCITLGHLESRDVTAAVEFARGKHPDEPIGVIGVSLGGASALLATPLGIDAMILESVFPDVTAAVHNRVADQIGPFSDVPGWLLLAQLRPRLGISVDQLRPIDAISHAGCPVFVLSGANDRHTTPAEAHQMFAAAADPKELWIVPSAAHVDLHNAAHQEYERRVLAFFKQHLVARAVSTNE